MKHFKHYVLLGIALLLPNLVYATEINDNMGIANAIATIQTLSGKTIQFEITAADNTDSNVQYDEKLQLYKLVVEKKYTIWEEVNDGEDSKPTEIREVIFEMPVKNIRCIEFGNTASGINAISDSNILVRVSQGHLCISGVNKSVSVNIWNSDGTPEYNTTLISDIEIDLSQLKSGIHVVSVNGTTFKILTK